jgi:hypothetical protein
MLARNALLAWLAAFARSAAPLSSAISSSARIASATCTPTVAIIPTWTGSKRRLDSRSTTSTPSGCAAAMSGA